MDRKPDGSCRSGSRRLPLAVEDVYKRVTWNLHLRATDAEHIGGQSVSDVREDPEVDDRSRRGMFRIEGLIQHLGSRTSCICSFAYPSVARFFSFPHMRECGKNTDDSSSFSFFLVVS